MSRKTHRDVYRKLEALYARLPAITCRRQCAGACGSILVAELEAERMKRARPDRAPLTTTPTMCAYLTPAGACSVYAARPLICRAYGLVKRMSCPHGCVPAAWLTDHEFLELAAAVEALAGPIHKSTPAGLEPVGQAFRSLLALAGLSPVTRAEAEEEADRVLHLRRLHGGRILNAQRTEDGSATFMSLEELRARRGE